MAFLAPEMGPLWPKPLCLQAGSGFRYCFPQNTHYDARLFFFSATIVPNKWQQMIKKNNEQQISLGTIAFVSGEGRLSQQSFSRSLSL